MKRHSEAGTALLTTILLTMAMSALLVGFVAVISRDQSASYTNREQTTAYAAAHAGLEQLTADLAGLFATQFRPTATQVNALATSAPTLDPAVTYADPGGGSGYHITFQDTNGDGFPDPEPIPRNIQSGPYQGLMGTVTPYTIEVTATAGEGEVRMRRTMQTVLIPAFQFGIFSDNDLSFFAGPNFDFGGRVHTNANLFLAEGNGATLWLRDRVTAVGEVIRRNLSNGWDTASNYTGTVRVARFQGDTTGVSMAVGDQSWRGSAGAIPPPPQPGVVPSPGSNDPAWNTFSVTTSNGNVKNTRTGARPLVLPLVQMGAQPIDLIRRPAVNSNEDVANPAIYGQRYYARATLRILLSDTAADLTGLPGVTITPPVSLSALRPGTAPAWYTFPAQAPIATAPPMPTAWWKQDSNAYNALWPTGYTAAQVQSAYYPGARPAAAGAYYAGMGAWLNQGQPLVDGFIKIELQRQDTTWVDITSDVLALGFTGRRLSARNPTNVGGPLNNAYYINDYVWGSAPALGAAPPCTNVSPNAIIRLQRVRDDHNPVFPCGMNAGQPSQNTFDYLPNAFFDPREGNLRDNNATTLATVYLGGVMHYVELDVRNLARFFAGDPTMGAALVALANQAEFTDGGYLVYVSDRRTNQRVLAPPQETGEYGFEDFVNPLDVNGAPNNTLDQGEDVNGLDADQNGNNLDTYGAVPAAFVNPGSPVLRTGPPVSNVTRPWTLVSTREARSNPPLFFRRALKIVNGAGTAANANVSPLTLLPTGRGLTIVSENPTYIEGNYNVGQGTAPSGGFGATQTDHRPSAVIADSVTLLSNNWNDLRSFTYLDTTCGSATAPTYVGTCYGAQNTSRRQAATTWYRTAIVSGKGLSFMRPSWAAQDFGTDGGAHNFLRYIENWGGQTINYRGSIISFFASRQATGTYKCCTNVYSPPSRGYRFDTEFLQLSLLPPKPPAFRDVNTLTFRQILRPTQQ